MTVKEFRQRVRDGEKLTLLDDMVLDVSSYAHFHPGGSFVIEQLIGKDISEYFHGGFSMTELQGDESTKDTKYSHSNYARLICNGLCIGKLESASTRLEFRSVFVDKEKLYEVNDTTTTVEFELKDQDQEFSGLYEIENLGKHMTITGTVYDSPDKKWLCEKVRRQYTLCQFTNPYLLNFIIMGTLELNKLVSKSASLTIKNYLV